MSRPQARIDSVFEEVVLHCLVSVLAEPNGDPFLCCFHSIGLFAGDEKLRVSAGGEVQDKLASRMLGRSQRLGHIHFFQLQRSGFASRLPHGSVCWSGHIVRSVLRLSR